MDAFPFAANLSSILGLVVSAFAWAQVARLKRSLWRERQLGDVLAKARRELSLADNPGVASGPVAIRESRLALKRAVVHVQRMDKIAGLNRGEHLNGISARVGRRITSQSKVQELRSELEVIVIEAENAFEELRRP